MTEYPSSKTPEMSRRAFYKGAGASAVGAALLESGLAPAPESASAAEANKVLGPGAVPVRLSVNGRDTSARVNPAITLVELLRNDLGLTGTKDRGSAYRRPSARMLITEERQTTGAVSGGCAIGVTWIGEAGEPRFGRGADSGGGRAPGRRCKAGVQAFADHAAGSVGG